MTLDEAIRHAEEVAEYDYYNDEQKKCANEHRQLAEWLRELKRIRESATDMDTISRQAAMAYPLSWEHYDKEHGDRKFISGVESYREYIEQLPSAERNGHWEIYVISPFDGEGCRCSECGTEGAPYWDYCPNCGARMLGEDGRA